MKWAYSESRATLLASQEEELRQNTEELVATQEEMQRKEKEYLDALSRLAASKRW